MPGPCAARAGQRRRRRFQSAHALLGRVVASRQAIRSASRLRVAMVAAGCDHAVFRSAPSWRSRFRSSSPKPLRSGPVDPHVEPVCTRAIENVLCGAALDLDRAEQSQCTDRGVIDHPGLALWRDRLYQPNRSLLLCGDARDRRSRARRARQGSGRPASRPCRIARRASPTSIWWRAGASRRAQAQCARRRRDWSSSYCASVKRQLGVWRTDDGQLVIGGERDEFDGNVWDRGPIGLEALAQSWTKNRQSPLLKWTRPCTFRCSTIN